MNPIDSRLDRLLEAAQNALGPPLPEPSPWFEQRMLQVLRAEAFPSSPSFLDGVLMFRMLVGAGVIMAVSVSLPLLQAKNPYTETIDLANSTAQLEKI